MTCSLIFVMMLSGKSERSKRVEYITLLLGNLVEASVTKAEISETKSSPCNRALKKSVKSSCSSESSLIIASIVSCRPVGRSWRCH